MKLNFHRIKILGILIVIMAVLLAGGYLLLVKALDLETYKSQILDELQLSLARPVSYKSARFTFRMGPALTFSGLEVREPGGDAIFVTMDKLTCEIDLLPLFRKQVVIHGLYAEKPVVRLERRQDGLFNISDLLESGRDKAMPMRINNIKLKDADIIYTDYMASPDGLVTKFAGTDLSISSFTRGRKSDVKVTTRFEGAATGSLSLTGKVKLSSKEKSLLDSVAELKLVAKNLDVGHFWPYYRQYVPFKKITGSIEAESVFNGRLREFGSTGKVSARSLRFDYQPVFKTVLTPKLLQLKYSMELTRSDLVIKALEFSLDGADVKGSCTIRDLTGKDPRITARAVSSALDLTKYQQYIPYGIIVKNVAEWIEEHVKGGIFRLEDGRLDGRVSQIAHMEKNENYNVLYVKAGAEKGVVSYGSRVPTFNNIKGVLELKGKDFMLHQMSGNFGASPLTLEGRIRDYPLDQPSSYPFTMTINPGWSELAWLVGKSREKFLQYNGNSSLRLTGDGFTTGYSLSGEWNLTPAAYSYAKKVAKPVGTQSILRFRGSISPKETTVSSLHYTLGAMSLDLTAKYPSASDGKLNVALATNMFAAEDIAGMMPEIKQYQVAGRVQVALKGESVNNAAEEFKWRGTLQLANVSLRPSLSIKSVSGITGTLAFDDKIAESPQLTARVGGTTLNIRGAISRMEPLAFNIIFSSPRIDLADFGFSRDGMLPQISKARGEIELKENNLHVKTFSAQINRSSVTLKGTVDNLDNPRADLSLTSSYLDIADILLLGEIDRKRQAGERSSSAKLALKATLKADSGSFKGVAYEHLNTSLQIANKIIYIQPLEAELFGGKLAGKGRIDMLTTPPRYQMEYKITNASAAKIMQSFSIDKRELTGTMSIEGDFTARGDTGEELKKSALGSVKVAAHNGSIRHFAGFSKVFSILNVSQLFKFRLPDMVSEGMPYNDVMATFALRDGTLATNDLFVTSNAMNMSLIGKYDFMNENLDFTLGVQPLQTVDKVVSNIPVVGWILTGKDKSLITTYFEIKGKSPNPQVSAIPVKYLGRGVFDIFKRVFQLPAKLVTDTGEVMLGR